MTAPAAADRPEIVHRDAQPYVAIRADVTMAAMAAELPPLMTEVFGWLGSRGIPSVGAPFWKYNTIDMPGNLEIEVGVPTAELVTGDDRVLADVLPAGDYASVTHVGHPVELMDVTGALLSWAEQQSLIFDTSGSGSAERWVSRLEIYQTDPDEQPDMTKWQTQLAFRLKQ